MFESELDYTSGLSTTFTRSTSLSSTSNIFSARGGGKECWYITLGIKVKFKKIYMPSKIYLISVLHLPRSL